jgi:hypothetical protein
MFSSTWGVGDICPRRREGIVSVGHNQNHGRFLRTSGTVIMTVLAAGLILGACSKTPKAKTDSSTTTVPGATTTAPTGTTTTVAPTPATTVPFSISQVKSGTGNESLAQYTVPASAKEWDLDWVYDCTKTPATTGSFAVAVKGYGSAANTTDTGVPAQTGHGTSGEVKNFDTGTFSLSVTTPCTWTVRVEIPK